MYVCTDRVHKIVFSEEVLVHTHTRTYTQWHAHTHTHTHARTHTYTHTQWHTHTHTHTQHTDARTHTHTHTHTHTLGVWKRRVPLNCIYTCTNIVHVCICICIYLWSIGSRDHGVTNKVYSRWSAEGWGVGGRIREGRAGVWNLRHQVRR